MADEVTRRRLDALEVLTRIIIGKDLQPEHIDSEIVKMKVMFVDLVDRIMDNQIEDSDVVVQMMQQCIPPLMTEILR